MPGWFSYLPFQWAAVLPSQPPLVTPANTPNESCWYLNPERHSREPLNKAVNEEVSSLNLFGSPPPPPQYPHLRASSFANTPLLGGWTEPSPGFLSSSLSAVLLLPGHLHSEAWLCPHSPGYRTKHHQLPGSKSLLACSLFSSLGWSVSSLGLEEVAPPSHH